MNVPINPPEEFRRLYGDILVENGDIARKKRRHLCTFSIVIITLLILSAILLFVFWPFGSDKSKKDNLPACFKGLETISNIHKDYDYYRMPYNSFHNDLCFPFVIILVKNELELRQTVHCALNKSLTVKARAGGHSYEGYSSTGDDRTVIIDLRFMDNVRVAKNPQDNLSQEVTVEAGATLGKLYDVLVNKNLFLPGGTCPSVGVAGLTGVGGKGPFGRKYGMFSDHVTSIRLVNYNSDVIVSNKSHNSDLFWALRGGGFWNFGIISEIKFNAIYLDGDFTSISMSWEKISAKTGGHIISEFQNWCKKAPQDISALYLVAGDNSVTVSGTFLGPKTAAKQNFKPFERLVPKPTSNNFTVHTDRPTIVFYKYSTKGGEYEPNYFKENGSPEHRAKSAVSSKSKSEYLNKPMPLSANIELMSLTNNRSNMTNWGFWWMIDCMNGIMSTQDPHMTAYGHRHASMVIQYQIWVSEGRNGSVKAFDFLSKFESIFRPYATGNHYLGYEDAQIPESNWTKAYHGSHVKRLVDIKKKYDPENYFGHTKLSL